ncbi:MAG: PAS domain-containing protein [Acidobacteriia bacterium]|nr:PAS domain-containing protein [Terriglobia bacterium]
MAEELSQETYRAVLEGLPAGVYVVDRDRRILLWNSGAEKLTGYLRQEVIGRSCRDDLLIHCDENQSCLCGVACPLQQTMHDGQPRVADIFLLHKDGQRVPVSVRAVPFRDEKGTIVGAVECFDKRLVLPTADPILRELSRAASVDELTRLPDHAATLARLSAYLEGYAASPVPFGVVAIAVDTLDLVRHAGGRNALHAVLYATGQTLANMLGPNDMIGRWSEERFLMVVTSCTASTLMKAARMMKRLVNFEGVPWWGDRLCVTLSMGGTIVRAGDTPETLVSRAGAALESSLLWLGDYIVVD